MLHQTLSCVLILASCVVAAPPAQRATKPNSEVEVVGEFARLGLPGEKKFGDTFGYTLQLWQDVDHLFGLFAVYVGPPADPPTGLLEDVRFDPRTRRFSFSARLSLAFVRPSGDKWVPTQDRFTFEGRLTRTEVSGTLRQFDVRRPDQPAISRRIKLRLSKRLTEDLMPAPASYGEWRKWADEILRRRGPQPSSNNPAGPNTPEPLVSAGLKKPAGPLYFIDIKNGWVVAHDNLYATADGGTSWKKLNRRALTKCGKVVFANPNVGWLLCDQWASPRRSNSLFSTGDGGRSWRQVIEVPSPIYTANLLNETVGFVSSRWQPLKKTTNGGKQWTELDGIEGLNYVQFLDDKNAWGYGGAVWRSSDGGKNWKQIVPYEQVDDLWTSSVVDTKTGWIIGGKQLWRTTDGETWQLVTGMPQPGEFVSIDFVSAKEGWLATADGKILHSIDGGATWQVQTKLAINLRAIGFVTNVKGWLLGANDQLLRTDDGGQHWRSVRL